MDDNCFDIILIGDNLTIYMASIYLQTSNYKQLLINIPETDNLNFEGFDKVAGVENVKNQADLLQRMREQTAHLQVEIVKEEIISVGKFEECKDNIFEVKTNRGRYLSKCLVYNNIKNSIEGIFSTKKDDSYNEAIVILGHGCKLSFKIRDYLSKHNCKEIDQYRNNKIRLLQ